MESCRTGRLAGKVAVITGGCSGMGLATARLFVDEGASVVVADISEAQGMALQDGYRGELLFARCDVHSETEIAAAVDMAVTRFGGLDIMFNNAGAVGDPSDIEEMSAEGWDRTVSLLLRGAMLGTKHAAIAMRQRGGGSIISNASVAALQAGRSSLAYSAAKAAVVQMSRMAAGELASAFIRVNSICPGFIATSIFGQLLGEDVEVSTAMADFLAPHFAKLQPLPRAGLPIDVAEACLFLASDASRFVTGTEIVVDGGLMVETRLVVDPSSGNDFVAILKAARDAVDRG